MVISAGFILIPLFSPLSSFLFIGCCDLYLLLLLLLFLGSAMEPKPFGITMNQLQMTKAFNEAGKPFLAIHDKTGIRGFLVLQ